MPLYRWNQVKNEQMNPLLARQTIHGETMTVARLELRKEVIVGAGEALCIPPHVPHSAEALEDAVAVDLFSPPRQDWIRGDDAYLRK